MSNEHAVLAGAPTEPEGDDLASGARRRQDRETLVGKSPAMRRVVALVDRLRGSRTPVLVSGETGVGKELVGAVLHRTSGVPGPMVALHCGAIASVAMTHELLGGSSSKPGALLGAHDGTLFLDEIGELSLDVQTELVRVLDSGVIPLCRGNAPAPVRVRVIAATQRDLRAAVVAGTFREDLLRKLSVVPIHVPPLRQRTEDLEPLTQHFTQSLGLPSLPAPVVAELQSRSWPGNVRELRNAVGYYGTLGKLPALPGARTSGLRTVVPIDAARAEARARMARRRT